MIISTSSSNAGIGFAVPIDTVRVATNEIISTHRVENNVRPAPGLLGIGLCSTRMKVTSLSQHARTLNSLVCTHFFCQNRIGSGPHRDERPS